MKERLKMESGIQSGEDDLKAVLNLAETCNYDAVHTHQVEKLALKLFDELKSLHELNDVERDWLRYAAILHDIGWIEGRKAHHKTALRIILSTPLLPFDQKERLIIGSIARYHRKALPDKAHDSYAALDLMEQKIVSSLAALLRVADGLDYSHERLVKDLYCQFASQQIIVWCEASYPSDIDRQAALKKGDLFQKVFKRELVIEWKVI